MKWTIASRAVAICLILSAVACAKKEVDKCKLHTGDGLCADPGKEEKGNSLL